MIPELSYDIGNHTAVITIHSSKYYYYMGTCVAFSNASLGVHIVRPPSNEPITLTTMDKMFNRLESDRSDIRNFERVSYTDFERIV